MTNRIAEIEARWEETKKAIEPYIKPDKCVEVNFRVDYIEYLLSALTQAQKERDAAKAVIDDAIKMLTPANDGSRAVERARQALMQWRESQGGE